MQHLSFPRASSHVHQPLIRSRYISVNGMKLFTWREYTQVLKFFTLLTEGTEKMRHASKSGSRWIVKRVKPAAVIVMLTLLLLAGSNLHIRAHPLDGLEEYGISPFAPYTHVRQDGRYIERLVWTSPHGELPGTYREYLQSHPLTPARITARTSFIDSITNGGKKTVYRYTRPDSERRGDHTGMRVESVPFSLVSVLVDEELFSGIYSSLDRYVKDLRQQGTAVRVATVDGGSPEEIKEWIRGEYDRGCGGVLMIGDITAAWAEVSQSEFPCDLFYMDLDGEWVDADHDGDYEIHHAGGGDQGPELYVARINSHTLTYDTEENTVNDYLAKVHSYRLGELTQPWRGLEYVEEDWYDMEVYLDLIYGTEVTRYDYGYFTTAEDYLAQMDLGQHFVQVCAHSYSTGHHFSMRPTESAVYAHLYVYSPSTRIARIKLGCDDGIKTWLNGENICTHDVHHGWRPDQYSERVTLNEGWNRLLCKISQDGGDFQFSARFTDDFGKTFTDLEYRMKDPSLHDKEGEFIRSWLLNGFHQDHPDNFWSYLTTNYLGVPEDSVNPEKGEEQGGKIWTVNDSGCPYIDLSPYCDDADYGVCYAFVRVYSNSEQPCQLWMGYDDGVYVWLNGELVLTDNRYGEFEQDMTKVDVNLAEGENRLLVKVSEWMGEHGFSARFCHSDGSLVQGLAFDPEPKAVNYIGTWLMNGPYVNPDDETRLSHDYLDGESEIRPDEGDEAPFGTWNLAIGNGCPFDIGTYYDTDGGWVFSDDIQDRDPPVLFYNLFACGPGRFTDENYLAGAYIFNTTWGLITVASSKSGSMLNFQDFTSPLGEEKTLGEAFRLWFDAQQPYELWEKEWYYGMVLCGDPTLRVTE
jgi:hypothetical protein